MTVAHASKQAVPPPSPAQENQGQDLNVNLCLSSFSFLLAHSL